MTDQFYSGLGIPDVLRTLSLSLQFVNLVVCAPTFRKKCWIVAITARIQFLIQPKWPFLNVGPCKKHHESEMADTSGLKGFNRMWSLVPFCWSFSLLLLPQSLKDVPGVSSCKYSENDLCLSAKLASLL